MFKMKEFGNFTEVSKIVADIIYGNTEQLDKYLHEGWDIEKKITIGSTVTDIIYGNTEQLDKYMHEGLDIEKKITIGLTATDITYGNIEQLDKYLRGGWDIEKKITIESFSEGTPLVIALVMESFTSVKWLVNNGVNLNSKENPAFCVAARYCGEEIIRWLVEHGAKVNLTRGSFGDAYEQALYGGKKKNLPLIEELGHSVAQYGGAAFRGAIHPIDSAADFEVLDFFIKNGVDINYNRPNQIYPFKPTPLCVAARYVDLNMCKYLVEHGADITLAEADGMRPYNIALERNDAAMAAYFKSLEPPAFHSLQNKLLELKPYKLPKSLLNFLQGNDLRIDLPTNEYGIAFIEFFPLVDTVTMKAGRQKVVRISKTTDKYPDIVIVWNPKSKMVAFWDMEHEQLGNIAPFENFIESAAEHIQKIFNGGES